MAFVSVMDKSSGKPLWRQAVLADTLWLKFKGIMLMRSNDFQRPLLFVFNDEAVTPNAIHSMFCLSRFDAVYLDSNKRVVDVIADIGPWKPWIEPRTPAKFLIECPPGQAKQRGVRVGQTLKWTP